MKDASGSIGLRRTDPMHLVDFRMIEIPGKKLVAARSGRSIQRPSSDCVEIRLPNQLEVRVSAGTDAQWVVELLQGLLSCSG